MIPYKDLSPGVNLYFKPTESQACSNVNDAQGCAADDHKSTPRVLNLVILSRHHDCSTQREFSSRPERKCKAETPGSLGQTKPA